MKCWLCQKKFKNGDQLLPMHTYVVNERRGDFAHESHNTFIHASHLRDIYHRNQIFGQI